MRSRFDPTRSGRVEVHNPMLALPAARHLAVVLDAIRQDAAERAETCWRRRKAPMAA